MKPSLNKDCANIEDFQKKIMEETRKYVKEHDERVWRRLNENGG